MIDLLKADSGQEQNKRWITYSFIILQVDMYLYAPYLPHESVKDNPW